MSARGLGQLARFISQAKRKSRKVKSGGGRYIDSAAIPDDEDTDSDGSSGSAEDFGDGEDVFSPLDPPRRLKGGKKEKKEKREKREKKEMKEMKKEKKGKRETRGTRGKEKKEVKEKKKEKEKVGKRNLSIQVGPDDRMHMNGIRRAL
jgi:hypothetical protein